MIDSVVDISTFENHLLTLLFNVGWLYNDTRTWNVFYLHQVLITWFFDDCLKANPNKSNPICLGKTANSASQSLDIRDTESNVKAMLIFSLV
jgi:hypothetical protein